MTSKEKIKVCAECKIGELTCPICKKTFIVTHKYPPSKSKSLGHRLELK